MRPPTAQRGWRSSQHRQNSSRLRNTERRCVCDGEQITHLHGEENSIEVSGLKADRSFYRKAVLACAGRVWHEVAFEYPTQTQGSISEFVNRAAKAVENSEDQGCEDRPLRLSVIPPRRKFELRLRQARTIKRGEWQALLPTDYAVLLQSKKAVKESRWRGDK